MYDPKSKTCNNCGAKEVCIEITAHIATLELVDALGNLIEGIRQEHEHPPCPECGAVVELSDLDLFACTSCNWSLDLNNPEPNPEPTLVELAPFRVLGTF